MVIFAVKDLEGVFPFVLLRRLTDLQPGHLLAAANPHMLARRNLGISLKTNKESTETHLSLETYMQDGDGARDPHLVGSPTGLASACVTGEFSEYYKSINYISSSKIQPDA